MEEMDLRQEETGTKTEETVPGDMADTGFETGGFAELHFLSGRNVGSVLRLVPGEYLLGNTGECDVIFGADSGEETVFRLRVGEDLTVAAASSKGAVQLYAPGNATPDRELGEIFTELTPGSRLMKGAESLIWYRDWSAVSGSSSWIMVTEEEFASLKSSLEEALKAKAGAPAGEPPAAAPDDSGETSATPAEEQPKSETAPGAQAVGSDPLADPSGEPVPTGGGVTAGGLRILLTFLGLVVLGILLILLNWGNLEQVLTPSVAGFADLERYATSFKGGKLFAEDRGQIYRITGVVRSEGDYRIFLEGLPRTDMPVEMNVKLLTDAISSVERAFAMYDITVTAVPAGDHFDVFGYILDDYALADVLDKIRRELPASRYLNPRFTFRRSLQPRLHELSSSLGFGGELLYGRGYVAFSGPMAVEDQSRLEKIRKEAGEMVGGRVSFRRFDSLSPDAVADLRRLNPRDDVPAAAVKPRTQTAASAGSSGSPDPLGPRSQKFTIKQISSVSLGKMNSVILTDGSTYFAGGKLPGNYVITRIESDFIEVEKDGRKETLKLR